MNKTKVISNMSFEDLSKSYQWTNSRGTFPANYWNEILFDFLYNSLTTKELEQEYRRTLTKASKTNKSSNNMYISVLLNKLLLNKNSRGILNKMTDLEKVNKIINDYIDSVLKKAEKKYEGKIKNNWKLQIKRWNEWIDSELHGTIVKSKPKNIKTFIEQTKSNAQVVEYKFNLEKKQKVKAVYVNEDYNEDKKQMIGKIGEEIIFNLLVNKYGFDNVYHTSKFNKYSPYDFEIVDKNGNTRYIEVKATTKINRANWYISRRELEFQKQNQKQYDIYFVKNIFISDQITRDDAAVINYIKSPTIKIDETFIGYENNFLIVTPISYKGLI